MDATTRQLIKVVAWGICGTFAYVMLELWFRGRIKLYLNANLFSWPVVIAGVLLAAMVLIRPLIWALVQGGLLNRTILDPACCHHDHGHDHKTASAGHDHESHAHNHDVASWKLIVLTFPLMMLMAGLVPANLSAEAIKARMARQQEMAASMTVGSLPESRRAAYADPTKIETVTATMKELSEAARSPALRLYWEATDSPRVADVVGQFFAVPGARDKYQLSRLKMTCCAQDANPITVIIKGEPDPSWREGDWLSVLAPVAFQEDRSGAYTPILYSLMVSKMAKPPSDLMLQ